ncbi:MAG TPA: elongation factor Ts [Candidatus Magasanikbacteria bacterium]|nr:MAG: elongation factor Ts [Candidatus Magasanikbacteria bacterium RIFCSPLOWO2_02_FULL_47_16]OGH79832.1 MAG: elongation factor Ts [Candidatus Magasanikbacteria bacterium RIFCSPHIGHO2_02_FULL_48_18]OGH83053.1 MAG: elongation factor Ts [Candidatus Magasanikbacteria bacterium RIFCSPLOWO2_12_FULL_47_9b]HAZ28347.1 elongation factor Ts [Candidatus Magasanikbacteria bacterium]
MTIDASRITKVREQSGAGVLDCKKALEEANGNVAQAVDILRKKGIAKAAKRAGKIAAEGAVGSYIHGAGKIGVLVEVNCETDFVAKTDAFQSLVSDIAMHIAAAAPQYICSADVPGEHVEKEKDVYREQLKTEGKPAEMIENIIQGKMAKFYKEVCLLEQPFIKDEEKTIQALLDQKTAEIGEKIQVRRFARFALGEGIEKETTDFVREVQEQLGA